MALSLMALSKAPPFLIDVCCSFSRHDIEMRKLKEVHAAAEKLRREKWMDEKTKKIKVSPVAR